MKGMHKTRMQKEKEKMRRERMRRSGKKWKVGRRKEEIRKCPGHRGKGEEEHDLFSLTINPTFLWTFC